MTIGCCATRAMRPNNNNNNNNSTDVDMGSLVGTHLADPFGSPVFFSACSIRKSICAVLCMSDVRLNCRPVVGVFDIYL